MKDLKANQLKAIRSLQDAHVASTEIVSIGLARRLASAAYLSRRMIGVIVDRRGAIQWVIAGDSTRLYLPDIGRIRGGNDRLRGLRLIVARPTPLNLSNKQNILSNDFKTDLEKLRLDAVVEIDASRDQIDGPLMLGYLGSEISANGQAIAVSKTRRFSSIHQLDETFPALISAVSEDLAKANRPSEKISEHSKNREKAILVGIYGEGRDEAVRSMEELSELARSANVDAVEKIIQLKQKVQPKTVIGPGKLEEICLHALSLGVETLIFDRDLSPSQLVNITDSTDLKILDRTMLILDIFAQRAVTREGKLQVEMAQLTYSLPRLAKKQSGLSRLTGGIGGRGPGETKLEVNRRRVKERLARLSGELEKIKKQRELRRKVRKTNALPTLAIVGYTNAGKSTLINALSGSQIYAKDELFATLDPHSRRLRFPRDQEVLITDTVGFINHLPDTLMRAFKATLEELRDADLLLHVIDIASENYRQQIETVNKILRELGLEDKATILVLNKIDKLDEQELSVRCGGMDGIKISAKSQQGLAELLQDASLKLMTSIGANGEKYSQLALEQSIEEISCD